MPMRLNEEGKARIRHLREVDGLTVREVIALVGCSASTVKKFAPGVDSRKTREGDNRWRKCEHAWGPEHSLRLPTMEKYGTLAVCVRCRARRYVDFSAGVRLSPPVPRSFKRQGVASGVVVIDRTCERPHSPTPP